MPIENTLPPFIPQNISLTEVTTWAHDNSLPLLVGTAALGALALLCRPQAQRIQNGPSTFVFYVDQPFPTGNFFITSLGMLKLGASATTTNSNVTIDSQKTHLEVVITGKPSDRVLQAAEKALTAWKSPLLLEKSGAPKSFNVTRTEGTPFTFRIEIASSGELNSSNLPNVSLYETKATKTASTAPTPSGTFVINDHQLMPSGTFVVNPSGTVTASGIEAACASAGAGALTGPLVGNITIDSQGTYLQIKVSGEPGETELEAAERAITAWKARHRRALDVETEYKNTFKITGEGKGPYTFRIEVEEQTNPLSKDQVIEEKRKLDLVSLHETKGPGPRGSSVRRVAARGRAALAQQFHEKGWIGTGTFQKIWEKAQ